MRLVLVNKKEVVPRKSDDNYIVYNNLEKYL
jgi:hypothetical protein